MQILQGKSEQILKTLPDNSVDSIVTDPPYELGFMGKAWDNTGIAYNVALWKECLRVLKPGGHLLAFGGSRTYHRMAVAIEDAGFEIRDMIEWVYGSGFPKSLNIGKAVDKLQGNERETIREYETHDIRNAALMDKKGVITVHETKGTSPFEGYGTALKPAHEPICMARKPLSEKTVAENCLKWGTGGINIDGSRVEGEKGNGVWGSSNKTCKPTFCDSDTLHEFKSEQHTQGRFPANFIMDEEAGKLLDKQSGITKSGKVKDNKGAYNCESTTGFLRGKTTTQNQHGDSGGVSRFFYCAKASKSERNEGCEALEEKHFQMRPFAEEGCDQSVLKNRMNSKNGKNNHPTVKPVSLMRYLVKLVTPAGGTTLDPFGGSGTTLVAAIQEGFNCIIIEELPEHIEIINARSAHAIKTQKLKALSQLKLTL